MEQQNKELIATLQIVKDVIEMNPAGAITDTIWISDDPMETETLIDRVEYILNKSTKEERELLDDSEQRRKDLMLSLRNVLDRKKELEHQNKELIATLQIVKDVIEMNPAGAITDTTCIS